MGSKTKWNTSDTMDQISDQSRVMGKMGVLMVYLFSSSSLIENEQVNQMHSLEKALPAVAGGIARIDPGMHRDIHQRTKISRGMQPGDPSVLIQHILPRSRLHIFIQIMNGGPNLVYLHLNNLLVRVCQGKDLDRYTDLFQSQDLVQYKGL